MTDDQKSRRDNITGLISTYRKEIKEAEEEYFQNKDNPLACIDKERKDQIVLIKTLLINELQEKLRQLELEIMANQKPAVLTQQKSSVVYK